MPLVLDTFFDAFSAFTATHAAATYVADGPGVYAFYPMLDFDESRLGADLRAYVQETRFAPVLDARGLPRELLIAMRGRRRRLRGEAATFADSASPHLAGQFAEVILACSIFQNPWYIGKADSLRTRFRSHLDDHDGAVRRWNAEHPDWPLLYVTYETPLPLARAVESFLLHIVDTDGNTQRS